MNEHSTKLWHQQLDQFTGSQRFHTFGLFPSVLTEGTEWVAKQAKCYWLFDAIESHIRSNKNKKIDKSFVVAELTKNDDNTATLHLHDGTKNYWAVQDIEYTDFPLKKFTTWACPNDFHPGKKSWTHMLPSEY